MFFMHRFLALRRLFSWFAILAILGGAVAPTISHALAKETNNTAHWSEICSTQETKVSLDSDGDEEGHLAHRAQHSLHFEHCPFCVLHAAGMPSDQKHYFLFPVAQETLYPLLFFSAPRPLFAWSVANPRAPPILS
jgi:hypothetical protein